MPTFLRVLEARPLRLFFTGQAVSLIGTWMQSVAQAWLVYRLTGSAAMLGLVQFLSQAPVFFLGIYGGVMADRHSRRHILLCMQAVAFLQAATLALLTFTGVIRAYHLLPLAALLGVTYAFEIPARQSLLGELAGEEMPRAVALNSTLVNTARIVGPAVAGYLIAAVGEAWCFLLNAASFLAVLYAVYRMETPPPKPSPDGPGALRHLHDGLAYARDKRMIRALLILVACSSFFGMPYTTLLPVMTDEAYGGGPTLLGRFFASAGAGALCAALTLLLRKSMAGLARRVALGATLFGAGLLGFSLVREPLVGQAFLFIAGFGFISQMAGTMTLLQALAPAEMRGRVVGLYSTLFTGVSPFGGLAAGAVASHLHATTTLATGALAVLGASALFHLGLPSLRRVVADEHPAWFPPQVP